MTTFNKDAQKELAGLIKENLEEMSKDIKNKIEADAAERDEKNAKMLEAIPALKEKLNDMQGKLITLNQNTGTNTFLFKGFDPNMSKNFRGCLDANTADQVAKVYLNMAKGTSWNKAFDGSYAVPVQYGNTLMGLAELQSTALTYATVIVADSPTINLPVTATRSRVDSQASGTANIEDNATLGQLTWTIDKRVGGYLRVTNAQLEDANFDIVNQFIIPKHSEAIGQNADTEMFNGVEFTTSVADATASVTASGVAGIAAAAADFDNINTMFYALEWERGIQNPMWFGSRAVLKDIAGLKDDYGRPIFQQVPINGRPSQTLMGCPFIITPTISNTPANGAIRLAFGDPRHYTIFIRGSKIVSMINPYVEMKEDITQFICKARMDGNISDHATAASSGAWTTMKRVDA